MQKNILFLLIILAALCFLTVRIFFTKKKDLPVSVQSTKLQTIRSTSYYKDRYNPEHAQKQELKANLATADLLNKNIIDSVVKALNISKRNIKSISSVSVVSGNIVKPLIDTIIQDNRKKVQYSDRWIAMTGIITDTPSISHKTYDSIVISTYRKKTAWFQYAIIRF
jgi:hypothetical protein